MENVDVARPDSPALARRAALADQRAFAELYRRHGPDIYGLCLRMSADAGDAEELMQGIFVRTWQQLDRFVEGNFESWLRALARNYVLNDRRTRTRLADRVQFDNDADQGLDSRIAISHETRLTLEVAVEGLPLKRRTVFIMHDVEGYQTEEIAQHMGIANSTVRVHLALARKTLAKILRP